jgi:plastocyanin
MVALGVAFVPSAALAAGTPPPQNATVSITDSGYSPATVSIAAGGTITWVNNGGNVHTASPAPGVTLNFDSGGLGPGQSFSFIFSTPGIYNVTSATDCLNGVGQTGFNCAGGVVNVLAAGATVTPVASQPATPAPPAPPAPSGSTAATGASSQNASVTMNDGGFSPATVKIKAGGTVTWVNNGQQVHSASANPGVGPIGPGVVMDTGGVANGQSAGLTFLNAGTFSYTSAPDCLNGSNNPAFPCAQSFQVVVTA